MENAPELPLGLELYYRAFGDLDRERPVGMSEGRIPRRALLEYAEYYDLDDDQIDLLLFVIPPMDDVLLSWRAKRK